MNLNETELAQFKDWLKDHLKHGPVAVTFTKRDGTERVMKCTLSESLVPIVEAKTDTRDEKLTDLLKDMPKKERKVNEDVLPVYDLESKAWKSFRWDSIKHVTLTLE